MLMTLKFCHPSLHLIKKQAHIKAIHIADALQALIYCTKVNGIITWKRCCEVAIEKNYNQIKCARTIMDWYIQLHESNLLKFRRSEKGRAAYFMKSPFVEDESLTLQFKSWARSNLEHLSVRKAWDFINLKLLNKWPNSNLRPTESRILKTNFALEIYEHCWIQMAKRKYLTLRFKKESRRILEDKSSPLPSLGGNLSVCKPKESKAKLVFGEDEAIYRSSHHNDSCWTVDGKTKLCTKGLGMGVMVSAFVARALGFGLSISEAQMLEINTSRAGAEYADEEAAWYLNGNSRKTSLIDPPFIQYLNYGTGKDGYWTYRHMVIQIEDCVDCLNFLYPEFEYVFELDHSSGHAAERPDGHHY